jgi:hypothetical protein
VSDLFDAINQMHPRHRSAEADKLFKPVEYRLIDEKVVKFSDIMVHEFNMGDVEDPDLYAAQPLWDWQQSEAGQWVMENAVETPFWHRCTDPITYGHRYYVVARLSEPNELFWRLKWGGNK